MSSKILVTGAAGGNQGATGNRVTRLLREKGLPVRAFVRKMDDRSDVLREMGAEVFAGDLVNIQSVRSLKIKESIDREGSANQEGKDHLISLWESFLNLNQDQEFMARMAKGHGAFKMMTGESPTPLIEWLKLNQTAIEGDGTFQSSLNPVNAR